MALSAPPLAETDPAPAVPRAGAASADAPVESVEGGVRVVRHYAPPAMREIPVYRDRWSWVKVLFSAATAKLAGIVALTWWMTSSLGTGPVTQPPGVMVRDAPIQNELTAARTWEQDGVGYRALATYDISARILHKERYRLDRMSDIAPLDLGVGWGMASDQRVADVLHFSNGNRFLSWNSKEDNLPWGELNRCMSNMHMIPADEEVRARLLRMREGQIIRATGYLVEVTRPGMNPWTSSLSRLDTGDGACEIMWVESATVLQ